MKKLNNTLVQFMFYMIFSHQPFSTADGLFQIS